MADRDSSAAGWKAALLALGGATALALYHRRRGLALRDRTAARLRLP